ncbi:hypothetical protein [Streptomyces sp. WZ-12]|uniref:hypothetical protein n=1 Tax=Streptomyces sp. WZ-12 TaxID=3030210 RepID=UPI0023819319|nr:hypothetical protein [Streptomyces sp. WZ-12]
MTHRIASLFLPLLRLLLPAAGRHRADGTPAVAAHRIDAPRPVPPLRSPARPPTLLRGEDSPLVRPYVLGVEERQGLRRGRRRALWLAVHGVDVDPLRLHGARARGMEVAA